jgi:hypothetical protein
MQAGKELSDFVGCWRFERDVRHADGTLMQITGTADFGWQGDALLYQEQGKMRLTTGQVLQAQRRYLWQQGLRIYFEDGAFFHTVPPLGGAAEHWCAPDDYQVSYDFEQWPRWLAVWQVKGPSKNYTMTTEYSRA